MCILYLHSCLNPTFSGMWSATFLENGSVLVVGKVLILLFLECGLRLVAKDYYIFEKVAVLILLFLECGLRRCKTIRHQNNLSFVLILLFLECGLRQIYEGAEGETRIRSLNPTFSGMWSATIV